MLTLRHHPPDAVGAVLDLAAELKAAGPPWPPWLEGRVVGLIFERPSTRTRVVVRQRHRAGWAARAIHLSARDMQLGRGETIEDTAQVLSRLVDADRAADRARTRSSRSSPATPRCRWSTRLTYEHHPCQALADAQTLRERFGALPACASPTWATATTAASR